MDDLDDIEFIAIHCVVRALYEQNKDPVNYFHTNEVNTWTSLHKPSFQDFLNDELRCLYEFMAVVQLEESTNISLAMYHADIKNEFEKNFGWNI